MRKSLLLLIFLTITAGSAMADMILNRAFPANGVRGKVGAQQDYPDVLIGKQILRLTPGARIYDRNNRIILHAQLPPGSEVLYSRDASGAVQVIYMLTEQEIARLKAAKR